MLLENGGRRMGLAASLRWLKLFQFFRREKRDPLAELQAFLDTDLRRTRVVNDRYAALRGMNGAIAILPDDMCAGFIPGRPEPSPRGEGEARVCFRDGEQPGVLEILSFDAAGQCTVHRVSGLALMNLCVKAVEQARRGATSC